MYPRIRRSFLDEPSALQRAVCPEGDAGAGAVRRVSQAVMVAWAETMIRRRGIDFEARSLPPYPLACGLAELPGSQPAPGGAVADRSVTGMV